MPTITSLSDILTDRQIKQARSLYECTPDHLRATRIHEILLTDEVMAQINFKLSQPNDPRYIAYVIIHFLSQP